MQWDIMQINMYAVGAMLAVPLGLLAFVLFKNLSLIGDTPVIEDVVSQHIDAINRLIVLNHNDNWIFDDIIYNRILHRLDCIGRILYSPPNMLGYDDNAILTRWLLKYAIEDESKHRLGTGSITAVSSKDDIQYIRWDARQHKQEIVICLSRYPLVVTMTRIVVPHAKNFIDVKVSLSSSNDCLHSHRHIVPEKVLNDINRIIQAI